MRTHPKDIAVLYRRAPIPRARRWKKRMISLCKNTAEILAAFVALLLLTLAFMLAIAL